ncbi:hypothetical protein GCM10007171_39920 [Dickeya fangzhongdai]|uniref:Uncharacterized protein n=1 Tax=Dickeya fangzhongdai TaxID=1778540 RepID=A0A2K8QRN8_9GAMM|nr:hypothetical protein CVE23_18410 [Dickeya fangzhongdai]GGC18605.1 hypothetical protein GCM10007171_39920 [Dickeya fangzhongdai]
MYKKALEYFCIAFNHMGECDEYARIEREHPELKHLFSYEFAVSRAERAKFQGRFKAIELVLTKSMAEKPKSNS